ncbi:MAG: InlB B-repeat-containing protein, partial [Flavobacteriales bacterium]|nr:InlB B-repeat-containing protein [Flavobacteriales bacterium]
GTFTMKGGTIRNCKAIEGGAVYIKGIESPEFIMEGGEIINNISETNGGAVYLEGGTVTISGGQLRSNLAKNGNGGAIYINAGDFYMTEGSTGSIFRNVALKTSETNAGHGGGIYVTSVSSDVDVEVLSGRVENNMCDGNGGGICVDMAGTTRTANVKIGKDGVVSDNNPSISTNSAVRYGGGLYAVGEMAKVTINGGKISGNEVFNYVPNPDVTNEGGTVVLNGGQVKHQVVTFDANAADATVEGASTAVQRIVTATNSALVLPETPERNFYDFIGWNSRPDGQGKTYVNGENMNITEDITLYAQWRAQ